LKTKYTRFSHSVPVPVPSIYNPNRDKHPKDELMKTTKRACWVLLAILLWFAPATQAWYSVVRYDITGVGGAFGRWTMNYRGEEYTSFMVDVPTNTACLIVRTEDPDGWGDCELYVRYQRKPTLSRYSRRHSGHGHVKSVYFDNPSSGRYYIRLRVRNGDAYRTGLFVTRMPKANPNSAAWRQSVLSRINLERSAQRLSPLTEFGRLNNAAQFHADEMVRLQYFGITGRTRYFTTVEGRVFAAGYDYWACREIIAHGSLSTSELVRYWMERAVYRNRILSPFFTHAGLAWRGGLDRYGRRFAVIFSRPSPGGNGDPRP
jgi:uncharacterized protein YkwD